MMTDKALEKLKMKLPRGYVKKIAIKAEVSESTVRKVLKGDRNNLSVIKVAIDMAKDNSQQINDAINDLDSL